METILVNKLAAYQGYMKIIRRSLMEWFVDSLRCQHMQHINPSMPSSRFRKNTEDDSKAGIPPCTAKFGPCPAE